MLPSLRPVKGISSTIMISSCFFTVFVMISFAYKLKMWIGFLAHVRFRRDMTTCDFSLHYYTLSTGPV